MQGKASGPVPDADRSVLHDLRNAYDMKAHTRGDSRQASVLTPSFIDRFAIAGTPETVTRRLAGLRRLGLDKIAVSGGMRGASAEDARTSLALLQQEALPALRAG